MITYACSLHPMDVRLLKTFIAVLQGGMVPDLKEEAARRRQRDILLNWSRRIIRAAAPLAEQIPRENWTLYTQYRPFFITADDPEQVAGLTDRLFTAHSLEEVLNFFREEVARLSPEQADAIVETAQQDKTPGLLEPAPVDAIEDHLRAYLLHQRRQIEELAAGAGTGSPDATELGQVGHWLAWRACMLLANLHPGWYIRTTSLTSLVQRGDLGLEKLVADPRGIYSPLEARLPGIQAAIPHSLSGNRQTGMCLTPRGVAEALTLMDTWPTPIMPHEQLGVPTPGEVRALREALAYAKRRHAGLWEATDLLVPEMDLFPSIHADQGEREEHPERFAQEERLVAETAPAMVAETVTRQEELDRMMEATTPDAPAPTGKTPWWQKLLKK